MNVIQKLLSIPTGQKTVEATELHEVRWTSRYGEYSNSTQPEAEVFTSKEGAEEFAAALRNAFKLIRHTSGTTVEVKKRN